MEKLVLDGSLQLEIISQTEMISTYGGNKWRTVWKYGQKILEYIGYYDAVNDAISGFNEGVSKSCCN